MVNAWLLYKRLCHLRNEKAQRLHKFKADVAEALCKHNKLERTSTSGSAQKRSKRDDTDLIPVKRARQSTTLPSNDVKMDKVGHFPQ